MKSIILTEEFYGHELEVTITDMSHDAQIKFIPDSVKEGVFELLECNTISGDFSHNDTCDKLEVDGEYETVSCEGTWRILPPCIYLVDIEIPELEFIEIMTKPEREKEKREAFSLGNIRKFTLEHFCSDINQDILDLENNYVYTLK